MRFVKSLAVATLAILVCSAALAVDGGYKQPNTGIVWAFDTIYFSSDWKTATSYAANYSVSDLNDNGVMTTYSDYRLPTVAEMQAAIADGTITYVNQHSPHPIGGDIFVWTSDFRGKGSRSAYVVHIQYGPNGEVITSNSGQASLALINSSVFSYMVRP